MLSYYFPPLVGIASERAASRADSLRRLGWDVTVVTVRRGHYHAVNQEQEFAFPVVRTWGLEISRIVRRLYRRVSGCQGADDAGNVETLSEVPTGRLGSRLRRVVRDWIYVPDAQVGWIPFAVAATARAAGGYRGAVILSTSVPYSAHLAAYLAARLSRSWWIAEFRDPWTTAHESRLPQSRVRRRIDCAIERFLVDRCDHVVVTSDTTRQGLLAGHPGLDPDRVAVVMNGFVPAPERPRPAAEQPCRFVYTGTVAQGERVDIVLAAFGRLAARFGDCFRLRVFGPAEPWLDGSSQAPAWLELRGVVTPAAAREAVLESSTALLLQGDTSYAQILRGKAFEYIGARRPILAVVPPGSEMAELLREHADVRVVPSYDVDALEAALEQLLEEHRAGRLGEPTVPVEVTEPLTREAQARILDRVLRSLVSRDRD